MPKTYSAEDVASYFLVRADESQDAISNLKLQKLCYYAQGIGLATRGEAPMFAEPVEAWMHGPVVPSLYRKHAQHGSASIPAPKGFDVDAIDPADRLILDDVFTYYGQFSAWRLREMTHEESPWKNNYGEFGGRVIPASELVEFFSGVVSDDYRRKYEQIAQAS